MPKHLQFFAGLFVFFVYCSSVRTAEQPYLFTTVAGLTFPFGDVDGPGSQAEFLYPTGLAVDASGNIYIAEFNSYIVRKITPGGNVTTLAGKAGVGGNVDGVGGDARFRGPFALAVDSAGNVYVPDLFNDTIRKITPSGVVTTFAGTPGISGNKDGPGTTALFSSPYGAAVDGAGTLYVADEGTHVIRKITAEGIVSTYAGLAGNPGFADGTGEQARFDVLSGIALDSAGNVYVADSFNTAIRKITPARVVSTLAGRPGVSSQIDGIAIQARFTSVIDIAADAGGTVYVSDIGTVRRVRPDGTVTTIAGSSTSTASEVDGAGADVRFAEPRGIAVTSGGVVYVVDKYGGTVRRGAPYSGAAIKITAEPQNTKQYEGLPASLTVAVSSAVPVSFQWQLEGRDIPGATNANLLLNPVKLSDAGTYGVTISNGTATLKSAAAPLTVIPTSTPGAIDLTFDPGAGADGQVDATVLQPDGRIIIAGIFKHFNHIPRPGIARLEASGALDATFDPGLGFEGPNLPDRDIQFLAIQKDGKILVGGEFTKFDGTPVAGAVRLTSDGKIDPNFHFPNTATGLLALQPDGKLITRWPVTRLFSDGTPDPSFKQPSSFSDSPATFPNAKRALVLQSGKLLAVSHTSTAPLNDSSVIVALNSDGTPDETFAANFKNATGYGFPLLAESPDGKLMVCWGTGIARYFPDGKLDPGFNAFSSFFDLHVYNNLSKVWTLSTQADGKYVVGGLFSFSGGSSLARLFQDGSIDGGFSPAYIRSNSSATPLFCCFNPDNGTVRSLAIQPDGRIIITGKFNEITGLPRWYVARIMGGEKAAAPVISLQPQSRIAFLGETLALTVNASGEALSYLWALNGTNLPNATNATLRFGSVRTEDAGKYSVTVTNTYGLATSLPATVMILPPALPAIVTQPAGQTVYEGTNANLFVVATNASTLPPFFQWQFNGADIPGATDSTLVFSAVRLADSGSYSVLVSNIAGTVTSVQAVLQVFPSPPIIIVQPQAQTLFTPTNLFLSVTARGTGVLMYQWRKNGLDLPGQTNASCVLTGVQQSDSGAYSVVITNLVGRVVSTEVTVRVHYTYIFTTLAGVDGLTGSVDGIGPAARFSDNLAGLALDAAGNVYVSDVGNRTLRRISPDGKVTTIAGQTGSPGNNDGIGNQARFSLLRGLGTDSAGNVYAADQNNTNIRKIAPDGTVTTLAGLAGVPGSVDGFGANARFESPDGLALDGSGNIYVTDQHTIRKITPLGLVSTVAGSPSRTSRVDGPGSVAGFGWPGGLAVDKQGNLFVTDEQAIRKIDSQNIVSTFIGPNSGVFSYFEALDKLCIDNDGNLFVTDSGRAVLQITPDRIEIPVGSGFYHAVGIAIDLNANIYVAESDRVLKGVPDLGRLTITSAPRNVEAVAGSPVSFNVGAAGLAPLGYQWRKDGVDLPNQASNLLVIPRLSQADAGLYEVVITDGGGSSTNASVVLSVLDHPRNDLFANASILTGTTLSAGAVNFSATKEVGEPDHAGNPVGKSIWWTWTVPGDGRVSIDTYGSKIPTALAAYTGSSPAALSVVASNAVTVAGTSSNIRFNVRAGQVYQIAVDSYNGAEGDIVLNVNLILTADLIPAIIQQPVGQTVFQGTTISLSVSATNRYGATWSYQWQRDGAVLTNATSHSLSFPSIQLSDAGSYSVILSNNAGTVTSAAAILTVLIPPPVPFITTQPQSQMIAAGGSGTFHVIATGLAPLTYTWRQDGTNYPPRTNADLTVGPGLAPGIHPYSVTVTDPLNRFVVSSEVTLTITNNATGLIAHWTFDEPAGTNVVDSAGGHNGGFSGVERIPGRIGAGALRFSGTNSFVFIGGMGTSLELAGTPYTIAFWMRPVEGDIRAQSIIDKGGPLGYAVVTTNTVIYNLQANSGSGGYLLPGTNWQHFAVTWDGVHASPYLNGRNNSYSSMPQLKAMTNAPLILGAAWTKAGTATNWFHGDLDDVRIYNYALTQVEIQDVMGEPPPPKPIVEITQQPASLTIGTASSATFLVNARLAQGSGTLNYQWYLGDGPIPWETNATYTVGPGLAPGQYSYVVDVSAPYAIPVTSTPALLTVTNGNSGTGPATLAVLGVRNIEAGAALLITNQISSLPRGNTFWTFDFATPPPAGASVDPATGLLIWEPSLAYSPSTNVLVLRATSSDTPPQIITTNLQVIIGESIELGLGSTSMPVGGAGAISLEARFHSSSDSPITNLSFVLSYPPSLVTNLNVRALNSNDVSVSTSAMDDSRVQIALSFNDAPISRSTQTVAQITFSARDVIQSAAGIISLASIQADKLNSNRVTRFFTKSGRLIVANHVPFLDASISGTNGLKLRLYGQPGVSYRLERRAEWTAPWQPMPSLFLTNFFQEMTDAVPAAGRIFYRAVQE